MTRGQPTHHNQEEEMKPLSWSSIEYIRNPSSRVLYMIILLMALMLILGIASTPFVEQNVVIQTRALVTGTSPDLVSLVMDIPIDSYPQVKIKQSAQVTFDAYPDNSYGVFFGELENIKWPMASDLQNPPKHFQAEVHMIPPKKLSILAGMQANIMITTGTETLFQRLRRTLFGY